MACSELLQGLDLTCLNERWNKYYQNVILINKDDVLESYVTSSNTENHIIFNLKENVHGFLFHTPELGNAISAEFSMDIEDNIPLYTHEVTFPVVGVKENIKSLIKQLDKGFFFAAVQYKDGTVEIYGFNYGLKNTGYTYEPQSDLGGSSMTLESIYEEYDPPYVYAGSEDDFNNLFENVDLNVLGEFNDDFNDDFNITAP